MVWCAKLCYSILQYLSVFTGIHEFHWQWMQYLFPWWLNLWGALTVMIYSPHKSTVHRLSKTIIIHISGTSYGQTVTKANHHPHIRHFLWTNCDEKQSSSKYQGLLPDILWRKTIIIHISGTSYGQTVTKANHHPHIRHFLWMNCDKSQSSSTY